MSDNIPPVGRDRPFPWRCLECREKEVFPLVTDYTITVNHDGQPYTIRIPDLAIPTCRKCGERVFTSVEDERILAALRAQVGLLTPQEIQERRGQLELSQQEMAEQLGVARKLISRWESGEILQSRAMDNLLRLFFASEEVRAFLTRRFPNAAPVPVPGIQENNGS